MCRWLAYSGPALYLSNLITRPEHSLLDQSVHARLNLDEGRTIATNGDGFGVGWYGTGQGPGLFRDLTPAWANENLESLAAHLQSPLFFAHVRARSEGRIQETNCHPFRCGRWLFQHNGGVGHFPAIRQTLHGHIAPRYYHALEGTTDSETCFLLALSLGLEHDPPGALARMIQLIEQTQIDAGTQPRYRFTCSLSDGASLWALRYASAGQTPPTLFVNQRGQAMHDLHPCYESFPTAGLVLVSEPLDNLRSHWKEIPAGSLVEIQHGGVRILPFVTGAAQRP